MRSDEDRVIAYFLSLGVNVSRFSKEEMVGRTPDFKLVSADDLVGYCEVKSSTSFTEGEGPDPSFNRLSTGIHEAVSQFMSVNPDQKVINVLAFVNHESALDERDLIAVFTGNFYTERGKAHPIYQKYSHGRINAEKTLIDVYLWFQTDEELPYLLFNMMNQDRYVVACGLFRVDPADVFLHD